MRERENASYSEEKGESFSSYVCSDETMNIYSHHTSSCAQPKGNAPRQSALHAWAMDIDAVILLDDFKEERANDILLSISLGYKWYVGDISLLILYYVRRSYICTMFCYYHRYRLPA